MPSKASMKEEGYSFVRWLYPGSAVFKNDEGREEIWFANKGHASWGFNWRGTDWEFASSV